MRYDNIKKASQDEQQNQSTTTNNNYIKNFMSVLKKKNLKTKSKYRQIKLKPNKTTYKSPEKIWDQSIKSFGNNKTKRTKTVMLKNSLIFFITINFKVMKTIRNQVIYPNCLRVPMLLWKGIKTCPYSIFYAAKENNKKNK